MPWRRRGGVPATAASAPDPHRRREGWLPVLGRGESVASAASVTSAHPPSPPPALPRVSAPPGVPPYLGCSGKAGGASAVGGSVSAGGERESGVRRAPGHPPIPAPSRLPPRPRRGALPDGSAPRTAPAPPALRRGRDRCGAGAGLGPAVGHASVAMTVDCYCPVPTQQ